MVGRCVVMGGAPCCEGNATPAAKYNIWVDPEAARRVFRSRLAYRNGGLARFARGLPCSSDVEVAAICLRWARRRRGFAVECNSAGARSVLRIQTGQRGLSLADPTAMAVALDRDIGGRVWSQHLVEIECASELTRGMTIVDRLDVGQHDENNRAAWADALAAGGVRADICWTYDAAAYKAMLKSALARSLSAASGATVVDLAQMGSDRPCIGDRWTCRTSNETSPYLLQHADNPVHWRPGAPPRWKRPARDKPILLSIGYAACHWCHVMAHESSRTADRSADERAVRQHQGRSRGAAGHRSLVHVGIACAGRAGRLAADHVSSPDGDHSGAAHIFRLSRAGVGLPSNRCCGSSEAWRSDDKMAHNTAALGAYSPAMSQANPGEALTPAHLDASPPHCCGCRPGARRFPRRAQIPQSTDLPLPLAERSAAARRP